VSNNLIGSASFEAEPSEPAMGLTVGWDCTVSPRGVCFEGTKYSKSSVLVETLGHSSKQQEAEENQNDRHQDDDRVLHHQTRRIVLKTKPFHGDLHDNLH
jgi:hypothetical protein